MRAREVFVLLFSACVALCLADELTVPLDTIVVQLRSEAESESKDLLNELLQLTGDFMNDYFGAYYAKTEPSNYFAEARITANSYGVQGVSRSFISTVEFDGVLAFNAEPVPSTDLIRDLLTNAFKGHSLEFFLRHCFVVCCYPSRQWAVQCSCWVCN